MKLLANENFPGVAVELLRSHEHDVLWARTDMAGAEDRLILQRVREDGRLLLTFDKDFGELAFRAGLAAPCGIILFRIAPRDPEYVAREALKLLSSRDDWAGHFSVVEPGRVRIVPLPP